MTKEEIRGRLPAELPEAVAGIVARSLNRDPGSLNTDWFGTVLMDGLLRWHGRGVQQIAPFARKWLDHHMDSGGVSRYSGPKSRVFQVGGIPITTYAGHFGLAFPAHQMALQLGDRLARRVCIELAEVILHKAARNHLGLVGHDDNANFAIPDTCFFAVEALMCAYHLEPRAGAAFRDQAIFQTRAYTDTFLVQETGLAKTILRDGRLGDTCWTRASGWLLWAITATLRYLPDTHPSVSALCDDIKTLANGIAGVQHPSGGFRVLLNEPRTPLETTGSAMIAVGLHEAVRRGWLDGSYLEISRRAWRFVEEHLGP
ncbi:MAG: hypothetical protein GY953_14840, partial [bacterium]|nr:hypothetical protein [bacterium]